MQLPPNDTDEFLKWVGPPVPGVAYKWATTITEYALTQGELAVDLIDYPYRERVTIPDAVIAVRQAHRETRGALTKKAYEAWRGDNNSDVPHSSTIASRFGWVHICELAGF